MLLSTSDVISQWNHLKCFYTTTYITVGVLHHFQHMRSYHSSVVVLSIISAKLQAGYHIYLFKVYPWFIDNCEQQAHILTTVLTQCYTWTLKSNNVSFGCETSECVLQFISKIDFQPHIRTIKYKVLTSTG